MSGAAALLAVGAAAASAAQTAGELAPKPPALAPIYDPRVWSAHFESWVTARLVRPELRSARQSVPKTPPAAVLQALSALLHARVLQTAGTPPFPAQLAPPLSTRGLSAKSLQAARLWGAGQREAALELLRERALLYEPDAAHLRAQLVDELSRRAHPVERLGAIASYQFALSLERESELAARARVRIAQIYLELQFLPESMASLQRHLEREWPRGYGALARATFAEAAFRRKLYPEALAQLESSALASLAPAARPWWLRRRGDSYFLQGLYAQAADAYAPPLAPPEPAYGPPEPEYGPPLPPAALEPGAAGAAAEPTPAAEPPPAPREPAPDPPAALRLVFSLLRSGQPAAADAALAQAQAALSAKDPQQPELALLGVWLRAEQSDLRGLVRAAEQFLARYPRSHAARLAAVYWIEGRHQLREPFRTPSAISAQIDAAPESSEAALLLWRTADLRGKWERLERLQELGELMRRQPPGAVRELLRGALAERVFERVLGEGEDDTELPAPSALDALEAELDPRATDENALLLAVDALARGGRSARCEQWSKLLRGREQRPLRRGLATWREMECARRQPGRAFTLNRLLVLADTPELGPFALAFGALAAENRLAAGLRQSGLRIYERGLEALADPQLLGPLLLRTGELHAAAGRDSLALRLLVRGLTVTDSPETARDPFRKAGLIALARVAARDGKLLRLRGFLERDLPRLADPWWQSVYRYLESRAQAGPPPVGAGLFAEGARRLAAASALAEQLKNEMSAPSAVPPSPTPGRPAAGRGSPAQGSPQ